MNLSSFYHLLFPQTHTPKTLALLRFDGIGDYMMLRPFFPYLRNSKKYKDYKLVLIGRDNFIPLAKMYDASYFDEILEIHYPPNKKEFKQLVNKLNQYHITELVSPARYLEPECTAQFFSQIKAGKKTAATAQSTLKKLLHLYQKAASEIISTSPNYEFEFNRYKSFFEQLIEEPIPLQYPTCKLPLHPRPTFVKQKYALFAPYTSTEIRNLNPDSAALCLKHLLSLNVTEEIYLIGDNLTKLDALKKSVNSSRVKTYVAPSICDIVPMVQHASLIFTTDTSFLHFGAQLGIPTIYVAGNQSYGIFHPYGEQFSHVKGIYPRPMMQHLDSLDPLTPTAPYTIKQISAKQICTQLTQLLTHQQDITEENMSLENKLHIILLTYNRAPFLRDTLQQLFAENSPIKGCEFTILDNHSTDETSDIIRQYQQNFPNIQHIIRPTNIGANANIANAFTLAKKEYVWVLCDDDRYDWTHWAEVEQAMQEGHDAIVVNRESVPHAEDPLALLFQLTFLPSVIYHTRVLKTDVLRNVFDNICHWLPHLAVAIEVFNTTKDFYVLSHSIVTNGQEYRFNHHLKLSEDSVLRGNDPKELYPEQNVMNWHIAFINSLSLLKGGRKAISQAVMRALEHPPLNVGPTLYLFCKQVVDASERNKACRNLFYDVYFRVNDKMRFYLLFHKYSRKLNPFYRTPRGIYIRFGKFKTKIIPSLRKNK